jgi:serine O-acetyltransferase
VNLFKNFKEAFSALAQDHEMCFGPDSAPRLWRFWHPSLAVTRAYRFSRAFDRSGWTFMARALTSLGRHFGNCDIHYRAEIEPGVLFPHGLGVVVGEGVVIKKRCSIFQNCSLGTIEGKEGAPILEEGVNLYPNTVVAGPLTIGEYSRVGPNVYLTGSIPQLTRVLPAQSHQKSNLP